MLLLCFSQQVKLHSTSLTGLRYPQVKGPCHFFLSPYALGAQQYCNKWTNELHFGRPGSECWLSYPELYKLQFPDLDERKLIPALACTQVKQLMPDTRQMMVQANLGCGSCRLCISPSLFLLGSLGWHSCHSTWCGECLEGWWRRAAELSLPPGGPWRPRWVWSELSLSLCLLQLVSINTQLCFPSSAQGPGPLSWDFSPPQPWLLAPQPAAMATGSRVTKEVAGSCFLLVPVMQIFRPQRLNFSEPTWAPSVFSLRWSSNSRPCPQGHVYQPDHLWVEESLLWEDGGSEACRQLGAHHRPQPQAQWAGPWLEAVPGAACLRQVRGQKGGRQSLEHSPGHLPGGGREMCGATSWCQVRVGAEKECWVGERGLGSNPSRTTDSWVALQVVFCLWVSVFHGNWRAVISLMPPQSLTF